MSELEARKYTSIHNLREEIRRDMEDYKLLWTDECTGIDTEATYLFNRKKDNDLRFWFSRYLNEQIDSNLLKLTELVEQNND